MLFRSLERAGLRLLSATTRRGRSVLHEAVVSGNTMAVERLASFQSGALLELRDENGHTALTLALSSFTKCSKQTKVATISTLLNLGANPFAVAEGTSVSRAVQDRGLSKELGALLRQCMNQFVASTEGWEKQLDRWCATQAKSGKMFGSGMEPLRKRMMSSLPKENTNLFQTPPPLP